MKRLSDRGARAIAIGLVVLTAVLAGGVALWRVLRPRQPHVEVDYARYPVRGLDISAHNGAPDFDSIAAAGIDFVYLKGQAANFLTSTEKCDLQLPMAIDIEEWGNPAGVATEIINERIATMVAVVGSQRGPTIIYTNKNGDARFVRHQYDSLDGSDPELWICSFTDPPLTRRPWRIWQHSHVGKVPGIVGEVDLNIFNGSRGEWLQWLDSLSNTIKQPLRR